LLDKAEFPKDAVLNILVSPSQPPKMWASSPHTVITSPHHCHGFCISGIVFVLLVGKQIPKIARDGCAAHNNMLTLTVKADELALKEMKSIRAKHLK
jgi:hypothetical protein